MIIIGCDYHPGFYQIAFVDTETGDYGEQRIEHSTGAEKFYRDLAAEGKKVRVGMEASGHARRFERLLGELTFELWIGDAEPWLEEQGQQQQLPRERNGALRTARIGAPQKCLTLPTLLETRCLNSHEIGAAFLALPNLNAGSFPSARTRGDSHLNRNVAARAPASCAAMKSGTSCGRIPAKVSENARAMVTAGFAKDVEAVNQYAAVM
jgi:hypothetical protein